jgi:hypothetical protein
LIAALIQSGRLDDAARICQSQLRGAAGPSDAAAKWTIRQSQVLTARQMAEDRFEDADVQTIQQAATVLLASYPEHRRRWFLEAENSAVASQAALHSVLRAAVAPDGSVDREQAVKRLLGASRQIESLSVRVEEARAKLDQQAGQRDLTLIEDLGRLQQELQIAAVSLALLQTDLFPRGSVDGIAAATKAEQAATDALTRLPAGTAARLEVERLQVEAMIRASQLERAAVALEKLLRAAGDPTPTRIAAMQIRLDIASGSLDRAGARLAAYYDPSAELAPPCLEMDLARLEFLLHSDRGGAVGAWLAAIEQRGGGYARRLAEALSLAAPGPGEAEGGMRRMDPALIAALGQDWLRRGEPGRAGDLLAAAAAAEGDPDIAIARCSEAAAALLAAGRAEDAADVLRDISLAKPDGAKAGAAHLQAMLMVSTSSVDAPAQLESMLRGHLKQWPADDTSPPARRWLQKLLLGQQRAVEAAEVATAVPLATLTDPDIVEMIDLWRGAFHAAQGDESAEFSQRFVVAFAPLRESPLLRARYRLAAALLLDRDALAELPAQAGASFADALLDFRQRSVVSQPLRTPPSEHLQDAVWRLMRDGRLDPQLRPDIARLLEGWSPGSGPSLEQAERLLWLGETGKSIELLQARIREQSRSLDTIRAAAQMLGSHGAAESRAAAIQLWDELASGSKPGSRAWHEAKLAAIALLDQAGNGPEAARRAKYILLTTPGIDDELKRRYESATCPSSEQDRG